MISEARAASLTYARISWLNFHLIRPTRASMRRSSDLPTSSVSGSHSWPEAPVRFGVKPAGNMANRKRPGLLRECLCLRQRWTFVRDLLGVADSARRPIRLVDLVQETFLPTVGLRIRWPWACVAQTAPINRGAACPNPWPSPPRPGTRLRAESPGHRYPAPACRLATGAAAR